jgi:hypothetical protein
LSPDWEVGHRKRAELLTELGRSGEAIASYTKRIELEPSNAFNWSDRGEAYRAAGDQQHALTDYSAAIERKQDDPRFWHARALTYQALGHTARAPGDNLDKTLELSPNYARAYRERAWTMGDASAARADEAKADQAPKDWPDPGVFVLLVALGLLLKPIDIIASVAAAILIRRRWLSLTVAVGIGVAWGLIGPLSDFTPRAFEELSWDMMLPVVVDAFPSIFWWGLARWLNGLRLRGGRPNYKPREVAGCRRRAVSLMTRQIRSGRCKKN